MSQGFTLVELLLVMALLGVLATSIFTLINPVTQFQRSRDAQRKSDLAQIQRALEQYYNDYNAYPDNSTDGNYYIVSGTTSYIWGDPWVPYMDVIPKDPVSSQRYIYVSAGQTYAIYSHLERGGQDPQACNPAGDDCPLVPAENLCNVVGQGAFSCNYGVTSPNISP